MAQNIPPPPPAPQDLEYGRNSSAYNTVLGAPNTVTGLQYQAGTLNATLRGANRVRDEVYRHLDITSSLLNEARTINALVNPTQFFRAKAEDKLRIAEFAVNTYVEQVEFELSLGYTVEDARKSGFAAAKQTYDRYMKQHDERYPKNITEKIATKLLGRA